MKIPILSYGQPLLRKKAEDIAQDYPDLNQLIDDMFETMYSSNGVGLAAPQVGLSIRLFVIDTNPFADDYPDGKDFKEVFINARISEYFGEEFSFNEGCLSVPDLREDVSRKSHIKIEYFDRSFTKKEIIYDGIRARVIQHEYDHLEGVLFVDKVSSLKKMIIKGKLSDISKGQVTHNYKMIFPVQKKI